MILIIVLILLLYGKHAHSNCPTSYSRHTYYFNKCYHVSPSEMKGQEYDAYCKSIGGQRASLHNKATQDFIASLTSNDYLIGLTWTSSHVLTYSWPDGKPLGDWSNIPTGNDPASKDDITYVKSSGEWAFDNDVHKHYALCEMTVNEMSKTLLTLVDGNEMCGRFEVYHDGLWGTVKDSNINESLGVFVCNYLGFKFGSYTTDCVQKEGTGTIWLTSITCPTNVTSIDDCVGDAAKWGQNTGSDHSNDVNIQCYDTPTSTSGMTTLCPSMETLNYCTTSTCNDSLTVTERITVTETATINSFTETITVTETLTITPSSSVNSLLPVTSNGDRLPTTQLTEQTSSISETESSTMTFTAAPRRGSFLAMSQYAKRSSSMFSTATVYDMRPSAVALGSGGVFVLVSVLIFIVGADLLHVLKFLRSLPRKNFRVSKKKARRNTLGLNVYTVYAEDLTTSRSITCLTLEADKGTAPVDPVKQE